MARVRLEDLVDHLDDELRAALKDAVRDTLPQVEVDEQALFRAFRQAIRRRCEHWERVPNDCIRA